jgi:hypothetical protein
VFSIKAIFNKSLYFAFQTGIGHGDEARAEIFAERADAARLIVKGEDSPAVINVKRLAQRP